MSNILNGITEAKRSPEPDYDDPSWDEKVSNVGQKAKQAQALKAKGKEPKTRWNPETKKYYVDFSDTDKIDESDDPFRGTGGAFNRGDDERHDLDPTDWYIVKDGKLFAASIYPRQVKQAEAEGFSRTKQEARAKASSEGVSEVKQRIDPKCWTGYKKQGTKMKGDTRVNNCVPKESAILEGISQVDEGWKSALGSAALAGAMALGAGAAHGRVVPGQDDPGINRLTGKPIATQVAQDDEKPAAKAPSGYSAEYLQSIIDGSHPRPMLSVEKAKQLLQQQQQQGQQ